MGAIYAKNREDWGLGVGPHHCSKIHSVWYVLLQSQAIYNSNFYQVRSCPKRLSRSCWNLLIWQTWMMQLSHWRSELSQSYLKMVCLDAPVEILGPNILVVDSSQNMLEIGLLKYLRMEFKPTNTIAFISSLNIIVNLTAYGVWLLCIHQGQRLNEDQKIGANWLWGTSYFGIFSLCFPVKTQILEPQVCKPCKVSYGTVKPSLVHIPCLTDGSRLADSRLILAEKKNTDELVQILKTTRLSTSFQNIFNDIAAYPEFATALRPPMTRSLPT